MKSVWICWLCGIAALLYQFVPYIFDPEALLLIGFSGLPLAAFALSTWPKSMKSPRRLLLYPALAVWLYFVRGYYYMFNAEAAFRYLVASAAAIFFFLLTAYFLRRWQASGRSGDRTL